MLKDALSQMANVFLPTELLSGQEYFRLGYVLNIRLSDGLLKARVKGKAHQIYDVHLDLKYWPLNAAQCSCPHKINCEHAVASLFALQAKENVTLPPNNPLTTWIKTFKDKTTEREKNFSHQVVYLLELQSTGFEHRIILRLAIAKRLKRGGIGSPKVFNQITPARKQYFSPDDEDIISDLSGKYTSNNWVDPITLRNSDLVEKILKTQRAYFFEEDEKQITLTEALEACFKWQLDVTGVQKLILDEKNLNLTPIILDELWYYDKANDNFGKLISPYPLQQLKKVLNLSPLSLEEATLMASSMSEFADNFPLPNVFTSIEKRTIQPKPIISFDVIEFQKESEPSYFNKPSYLFYREIFFDYEGITIQANDSIASFKMNEGNKLVEIDRGWTFEKKMQKECNEILPVRGATFKEKLDILHSINALDVLASIQQESDILRLHQHIIPILTQQGWQIIFKHPVYAEILNFDDVEWYSELQEKENNFFSYQLGILIDGKQVSIVPLIAKLITNMQSNNLDELPDDSLLFLPLPGGKQLQVTMLRVKPLVGFLLQYGTRILNEQKELHLSRYQLMIIQETEQSIAATSKRWLGQKQLRQQIHHFIDKQALEAVVLPKNLTATLRDYQHYGVNWLQFLRNCQFGGILADDMGLGKTLQTLAHLQIEKEAGRMVTSSLIIAPTSLVVNWLEEAKRFTPTLKILTFHGNDRFDDDFTDYDVVITTYGLVQRDKARFTSYEFYYLILDEAQFIKNPRAKTTLIIQQLKARYRLCLSGTPLENHLGELWSLFHFLMPGLLGDAKQFRKYFITPIEKNKDIARQQLLIKRVSPFMMRRTKKQVVQELPEKTEMTHLIELNGTQRDLYEAIRMSMEKKVRDAIARHGMAKSHIILLDALLKLRQVCCDPRLISLPEARMADNNSAKLDALMTLLDTLVDENRSVLIFSQFTSMLKLIEEELIKRQYTYLKLTGKSKNRQQIVNKFQSGDAPIFLISLKAGGTGLNLTQADTVIHYDPWWNPAVEDQATDRSHRIGQKNPVFVYKLITSGSVEEAILLMQNRKRNLFEGILSNNSGNLMSITDDDIAHFFMPLTD